MSFVRQFDRPSITEFVAVAVIAQHQYMVGAPSQPTSSSKPERGCRRARFTVAPYTIHQPSSLSLTRPLGGVLRASISVGRAVQVRPPSWDTACQIGAPVP